MKTILNIIVLAFAIISCRHDPPEIHAEYWAGDSSMVGIVREQNQEAISASDPKFDGYVCTTYEDMEIIHETYINECSVWRSEEKEAREKLEACGILTKKNIKTVTDCLSK